MTKIKQSNLDKTVITGQTEKSGIAADADSILIYDSASDNLKKIQRQNFILQGPVISSLSPSVIDPDGASTTDITVTGTGFANGFVATFIGNDDTVFSSGINTFTSSTSITIRTTTSMTVAKSPYDIKIVNGNGIQSTSSNVLILDDAPSFVTASGSVGTLTPGATDFSGLSTLQANDPNSDVVTHTISAGTLPTGLSLNTNGSLTGTVTSPLSDQTFTFTVQAATTNWTITRSFSIAVVNVSFFAATGGTVTDVGDYKFHTFTSDGSFVVSSVGVGPPSYPSTVDYFVLAGGGGGTGDHPQAFENGTGAGGGGFRISNSVPGFTAPPMASPTGLTISTAQTYPVTVGAGGAGQGGGDGAPGAASVFHNITSAGGAGAGRGEGQPGGSGSGSLDNKPVGIGNTPPVSPSQGNNGGLGPSPPRGNGMGGGGGGGAGGAGSNGQSAPGGAAGFVPTNWMGPGAPTYGTPGPDGAARYFAGGSGAAPGGGGGGGGATGGGDTSNVAANTGSGAGSTQGFATGGSGGSGLVVIRYKYK
jgi:hypothetical protein